MNTAQREQVGGRSHIRGLMAAVIVMGVLIVLGVATLAVTIVRRLSAPASQSLQPLNEPPGTRLQSIAAAGDRLAVLLTGGGPDRVILLDPRTGQITGRLSLAQ